MLFHMYVCRTLTSVDRLSDLSNIVPLYNSVTVALVVFTTGVRAFDNKDELTRSRHNRCIAAAFNDIIVLTMLVRGLLCQTVLAIRDTY